MSTHVDEGLLSKLVNKYGVENASKGPNRAKLWAKVTKDYNSITGNMHTKARLDKKWQNVKHARKAKRNSLMMELQPHSSKSEDGQESILTPSFQEMGENMWNVMDYALRDLFLNLVKRHNIEYTTNPRQKNELWKLLAKDFHEAIDNVITIKHEKFTKKWQNWKQYNKVKGKAHPLEDDRIDTDADVIREKIRKFRERARTDQNFATFLLRESDGLKIEGLQNVGSKPMETLSENALMTDSASTSNMSNKQLEREVYLEALKCEQERFRYLVENSRLEQDKLKRENELIDLQVQMAQHDLALKKQHLQEKGILLQ